LKLTVYDESLICCDSLTMDNGSKGLVSVESGVDKTGLDSV
jgi:hypothetical protein